MDFRKSISSLYVDYCEYTKEIVFEKNRYSILCHFIFKLN